MYCLVGFSGEGFLLGLSTVIPLCPSPLPYTKVKCSDYYVLSASLQGTGNTVNNLAEKERVLSQDFTLKEAWEP